MGDVYLMKLTRKALSLAFSLFALLFFSFLLFSQAHPQTSLCTEKTRLSSRNLAIFRIMERGKFRVLCQASGFKKGL